MNLKYFYFLLSVFILFSCNNKEESEETVNDQLVLNGSVMNVGDREMVYLYSSINPGDGAIDSVMLDSGKFNFVLDWKGPEAVGIQIGKQNLRFNHIILTPDTIDIFIDPRNREKSIEVKGSEIHNEYITFQDTKNNYKAETYDSLIREYYRADSIGTEKEKNDIRNQLTKIYDERVDLVKDFIDENPDSYISPLLIRTELMYGKNYEQLDSLVSLVGSSQQDTKVMEYLNDRLEKLQVVKTGNMAPEISQETPEGDTLNLSDFRGKYVLIDFWASWCGPCRKENPYMVKLYDRFKGEDFEIFGVSLDQNEKAWVSAIEADNINWAHVSDLQGWGNEAAQKYVVNSIPHTVLIDPDGKIIASGLRGESLNEKLEEIFRKEI
ncbi:TlpA disulfide reductase family protein [Mangrovivirga sp. M17]|uniref:TlpA disulfide reductase family protein n=1 Tax=Mangrovivirga halotolerans TaxID=2993936 RepID=A0ABT3RQC2_9BACT|nr:TlpA disulfide reductase family protein [Mangrovivirga halotolerans]MCX2743993.1 TlpA disulfide reductase family protein [Mangrovivirga halotolerans]